MNTLDSLNTVGLAPSFNPTTFVTETLELQKLKNLAKINLMQAPIEISEKIRARTESTRKHVDIKV